ncbi:formylglycine-generating enzyme family protein [Vibrio europaeus]|uniref:Formylglycine-generating enzyme family protein n=1 Tax=Vibrio europaeus TaxID=300876 RepID=A0A178J8J1_9VIBR|nr:SUMF1/EgtB/PvdO family nonheme iron enzyme [Vibrio europaeus]MDC5705286.1 SUMF1/EgtB/PvdO family nonheme iron enzyme [Vibrio europaeus]MDC5710565.1 formylglycine-generating enzyme family protein [Vibrio europaeus]MDC5715655.1 formylglycine-generating enzyme family protein [Vibrio europaeus]MDC5719816.1 formylglycine-generating enzyme family protein [Vibrio europaeus]MDC5724296.1 formylglycine-generating enzyme family protein [Vibrio europaeus]
MNNKWLGVLGFLPMLAACNTDIDVSSSVLSKEQVATIISNVNKQYPDADSELKQNIAKVAVKSIENMVFVEGGSFIMGDFRMPCMNADLNRPVWTPEASCYSAVEIVNRGADIQHEVTLSSYSMSKYEAELLDYDVYLQTLDRPFEQFEYEEKFLERGSSDYQIFLSHFVKKPAREVNWQDAKNYCQWLGQLTVLPVDLPTEAQWEYAARSRGQKFYHATNNGFKQYRDRGFYNPQLGGYEDFTVETINIDGDLNPVGMFAPNPLGIYDMSNNAEEWINDWYAKDYYKVSPKLDPQGPKSGEYKVVRGGLNMVTVARAFDPIKSDNLSYRSGFRCAIQSTERPY